MTSLKVAYVSPYPPEIHGVADYTFNLLEEMTRYLEDFIVVSNRNVLDTNPSSKIFRVLNRKDPTSLYRALKIINEFCPDIVHIQGSFDLFWPWLPLLVNSLRYPIVYTAHDPQIGSKRLYADETRKLSVIVEPLIRYIVLKYEESIYRKSNQIIIHDQWSKDRFLRSTNVDKDRIVVIPHGVDCSLVPKTDYSLQNIVLFFGFIAPHKGLDILMNAFERVWKKHPETELVVVGGVAEQGIFKKKKWLCDLMREIESFQSRKSIRFLGVVKEFGKVEEYLRRCDILVLPYKQASASGVLSLAQAYAIPVIASRVGAFTSYIIDGKTGILVEPNCVEDLEHALLRLLNDEMLREYIGKNARARSTELSWDEIRRRTYDLYSKLTSTRSQHTQHDQV